jgi:hypothetical protein
MQDRSSKGLRVLNPSRSLCGTFSGAIVPRNLSKTAAFLLLGLLLGSCDRHILTYRFRMTVEVMTKDGLRSGASIIEVGIGKRGMTGGGGVPVFNSMVYNFRGQSVEVILSDKSRLYALNGPSPSHFFYDFLGAYGSDEYSKNLEKLQGHIAKGDRRCIYVNPELIKRIADQNKTDRSTVYRRVKIENVAIEFRNSNKITMDCNVDWDTFDKPQYAYFPDISQPTAIKIDNPDKFSMTIGRAAKLWRVIVEPTDEAPVLDMDKRVPWLNDKQACGTLSKSLGMGGCGHVLWQPGPMAPPAGE